MATRTTTANRASAAEQLRISPKDAKARIERGDAVLLDVVQPAAWNELERVPAGAIRIPPNDIERRYQELPRAREIIAYCT
jgi:rhodanese-related sulfurtransferase